MQQIVLKKAPGIAPRGKHAAEFVSVNQEIAEGEEGESLNRLTATVQLEAKNGAGHSYVVAKHYNLLGRGVAAFRKDFTAWSGRELTDDEIESFDAEVLIKGKKVVVEIAHRGEYNATRAVIVAFHPSPVDTASHQ